MCNLCRLIWYALIGLFRSRASLEAENLVLRHQLNILRRRSPKKPTFGNVDRLVLSGLYRWSPNIQGALAIIKPETLIRWHRAGFRRYWRWESRPRGGRPKTTLEIRQLIREMSVANPLWGAPQDSWRTPQARHRRRADDGCQVHGPEQATSVPRMEDVFSQSC